MRRLLAAVLALLTSFGFAHAASTFSGYPPAAQPLGNATTGTGPTYVPMDQGSDCTSPTPTNCQTVQSDALRIGQPIQTTCTGIPSPWQFQLCDDTSLNPKVRKIFIGTAWWPIATLDPVNGYIPTKGGFSYKSVTKTVNYSLTTADGGTIFNNSGATGTVTFTLLPATGNDGFVACFDNVAATAASGFLYQIQTSGSDQIVIAAQVTKTGGKLSSTYAESTICLIANAALGQWVTIQPPTGAWNNNGLATGAPALPVLIPPTTFLGDSSVVIDPFPIGLPNNPDAHWQYCQTSVAGVAPGFNSNQNCSHITAQINHGDHTNAQKTTFNGQTLNEVFFNSGQNFGYTWNMNVFGSGDFQAITGTLSYRGTFPVGGDEGFRGLSFFLTQGNFHDVAHVTTTQTFTCGAGSPLTTQAITGSQVAQTVTVASSAGCNINDWVIINQAGKFPNMNIEAVQLTGVGTGTISGIFRINQSSGVTVTPALIVNYNAQTEFPDPGEQHWLVNDTQTPYTTGTVANWIAGGNTVNGTATAWSNGMAGGSAANPGCFLEDNDTNAAGIATLFPIQTVVSATQLTLGSTRQHDTPAAATYKVRPCALILRVITNQANTVTSIIVETNTFTWNTNDVIETAMGPQMGATIANFTLNDFMPDTNSHGIFIDEEGTVAPIDFLRMVNFTGKAYPSGGIVNSTFISAIDSALGGGQFRQFAFSSGTVDWLAGLVHAGGQWSLDQYGVLENRMVEATSADLIAHRLGPNYAGGLELDPTWQFTPQAHRSIAANIFDNSGNPLTTNEFLHFAVSFNNGSTWNDKFVVDETGTITKGQVSPTLPGVYTLFQNNIPFYVAPTGTMGNNGAITLGTALPIAFGNGVFLYLPASAIQAGSAAGWYCAVMSSATVGTVFSGTLLNGVSQTYPYTTGQPVGCYPGGASGGIPFVSTGPGAYTGVITAVNGPTFTIPGNAQNNFTYRATYAYQRSANTDTTNTSLLYNAVTMASMNTGVAANFGQQGEFLVWNQGDFPNFGALSIPGAINGTTNNVSPGLTRTAVDMTLPHPMTVSLQNGAATDFVGLEHFTIEEIQGP